MDMKNTLALAIFFGIVGQAIPAAAEFSLLRLREDLSFSHRLADDKSTEKPLFNQLSASLEESEGERQIDFDFAYAYDFQKNQYDFDLHQLSGRWSLAEGKYEVQAGRAFITKGLIRASVADHLGASWFSEDRRTEVGGLLGLLRHFELDQDQKSAQTMGLFVSQRTESVSPWKWRVQVEQRDFTGVSNQNMNPAYARSRSTWGKISVGKAWLTDWQPELNVIHEKNLTLDDGHRTDLAVNFYPSYDLTGGLRVSESRYGDQEGWDVPISALFSNGPIREFGVTAGRSWKSVFAGFDLAQFHYDYAPQASSRGVKGQFSVKWQDDDRLAEGTFFRIESFGGWAQGGTLQVIWPLAGNFEIELSHDAVEYEKITRAKATASATQVGLAKWLWKQGRVWIAGENRVNHFYSRDTAFLARLTVYEWREL